MRPAKCGRRRGRRRSAAAVAAGGGRCRRGEGGDGAHSAAKGKRYMPIETRLAREEADCSALSLCVCLRQRKKKKRNEKEKEQKETVLRKGKAHGEAGLEKSILVWAAFL